MLSLPRSLPPTATAISGSCPVGLRSAFHSPRRLPAVFAAAFWGPQFARRKRSSRRPGGLSGGFLIGPAWTPAYRAAPLARGCRRVYAVSAASSIAEAATRLEREPGRVGEAVRALLIGVTQFFRDGRVFSYLDQAVLPRLSAGRAGLRVWSVGCADGAGIIFGGDAVGGAGAA